MVKNRLIIAVALVASLFTFSCSSSSEDSATKAAANAALTSESDSLSYIIGMNVAKQLQKMDSLVNYEVVCRAILDHSKGKALMSAEEARTQYVRYFLYVEPERRRSIEEKFLADLATGDRSFTRTPSGLTYNIEVIGDEKLQPKNQNDWVVMRYSISRVGGEQIYPIVAANAKIKTALKSWAVSDMPHGVAEAVKLIGKGGRIKAWIPSKIGYGEEGNEKLGVKPVESLFYEIELVDLDRNGAAKHQKEDF